MLFINPTTSAKAAKSYHREHLVRSDYYAKDGQEITGQWHGRGADLLGLHGPVQQDDYFRLCDNLHPKTGEQLTARTKTNRRVSYDFTFDAPKSVSLAYELGGDERILKAFRTSVQETMAEAEESMCVRVRKEGQDHDRVTGNLVWAEFVHRTTRPLDDGLPDPQLHLHAVAFNVSYDPVEEQWKAGQFGQIKRDATYYQAAFHARFGRRLSDLGYGVEKDGNSFRLMGIDPDLCSRYSRRTQVIEAEAEKRGITDVKRKSALGKLTRRAKGKDLEVSELQAAWREKLTVADAQTIADAIAGKFQGRSLTATEAMNLATEHSFERASVLTEKQLLTRALIYGVGSVLPEQAREEVARDGIVSAELYGQRYVTTQEVCREEMEVLRFAREGRGQCRKLASPELSELGPHLSAEQRQAALALLSSRDRVTGLKGGAGTGKTTMMQATVAAIEAGGRKVFAFAPSAEASRGVLQSEGFANAETVERLLMDEKLQMSVRNQVLWVDEAGLLSTRDMRRLFDVAEREQCRVILSGDSRQHSAVTRGDALRLLEAEHVIRFAQLSEVRRQTEQEYREAVFAISQGDAPSGEGTSQFAAGIAKLDAMGAIVELEGERRYSQIAEDYLAAASERKKNGEYKTALMIAPTHAEAGKVTDYIREGLKARGRITSAGHRIATLTAENWTLAERKDATRYAPGQVIQFHQNAKGFGRGERVTVTGRNPKGDTLCQRSDASICVLPLKEAAKFQVYRAGRIELAAGDKIRVTQNGYTKPGEKGRLNNGAVYDVAGFTKDGDVRLSNGFIVPKDFGHVTYGYTGTSHASQGKTVDKVFIAMGNESLAAASREQFYVSVSRGRESVRLYTDDKEAMFDAVKGSAARMSATELLKGKPPEHSAVTRKRGLQRLLNLTRIRRTYETLRQRSQEVIGRWREGREADHGRSA